MPYTSQEIIAIVGAAAWVPQIFAWIYKAYKKPNVVIIADSFAELGFTSYGPIFNIRLAISTDAHDVLLDGFAAEIKHEDGETKVFRWQGTKETLNQIRDAKGVMQTVEKDETGIAIKVRPDTLADKLFRFQDPKFKSSIKPLHGDLVMHFAFLENQGNDVRVELMKSDKLHNFLSYVRSCFSWRAGKYTATVYCKAINSTIKHAPTSFGFELTQQDIEQLHKNFDLLEPYFEWSVFGVDGERLRSEPIFNWVYPIIQH